MRKLLILLLISWPAFAQNPNNYNVPSSGSFSGYDSVFGGNTTLNVCIGPGQTSTGVLYTPGVTIVVGQSTLYPSITTAQPCIKVARISGTQSSIVTYGYIDANSGSLSVLAVAGAFNQSNFPAGSCPVFSALVTDSFQIASGGLVDRRPPLGCGGGNGGSIASGTPLQFASYQGSATIGSNTHLDDGLTTASTITSTEPVAAPQYTSQGTGGLNLISAGGTLATPGAGFGGIGIGPGAVPQINPNNTGWVNIVGGGTAAANRSVWYVQRQLCGSLSNCTQIKADGRYVIDATSNSSTTITCPNNDCNFTSADVGKTVWGTTQGTGVGIGYLIYTTYVCPITTIQTVNSAQSITVGTACTANGTANVALYWASDDGTALAALDAAVGCSNVYMPDTGIAGNYILTSQPFLVTAPSASVCNQQITSSVGSPAPALIGTGFGASATTIMFSPSFVWANCKTITGASQKVCLGGTARSLANLQVLGSGLTSASNANCANGANMIVVSASPVSSVMYGVDVAGICPGQSGMIGVELNSTDETFDLGGVQEVGLIAVNAHAANSIGIRQSDIHNINTGGSGTGLKVETGAQVIDFGSYPVWNSLISGRFTSRGTHFVAQAGLTVVSVSAGAQWNSYGDFVGFDNGVFGTPQTGIANAGQLYLAATIVHGSSTSINNASTGVTISGGGNVVNAAFAGTGTWLGVGVWNGSCRGTATSSSTLTLYQMGEMTANTCTVAAPAAGSFVGQIAPIVPLSGSILGLFVSAGTGCKNGNTCVFTVMKNGSATTLTCSMTGGASACQDTTHFDVPIAGDTYAIQFTTGATETLANVTAYLLDW